MSPSSSRATKAGSSTIARPMWRSPCAAICAPSLGAYTLDSAVSSGLVDCPENGWSATAGTLAREPQLSWLKPFEHCGNNDLEQRDRNVPGVHNDVSQTILSFGCALCVGFERCVAVSAFLYPPLH
ncbi:hypothetical protein C8R45DRAFT_931804 [Mycena sanguinolenta]|nr:hypothetical protein C8R45DRAFT_931804 [Mycena sanguinolenta]